MTSTWKFASDIDTVREQGVAGFYIDGCDVALYAVDDVVFATENQCTHGEARLSDGFLLGDEIECPLHQGRFNVRTGAAMCVPVQTCIRTYPVKIEQGRVFISLETEPALEQPTLSRG